MKAVLFIHGYLAGPDDWDLMSAYLKSDYDHMAFYKQPGHERLDSDKKPCMKDFTCDAAYKGLDELFDSLETRFDTIDVIGHSMGGAMAVYLAATRKIRKLVLVAPATVFIRANFLAVRNSETAKLKKIAEKNGNRKLYSDAEEEFKKSVDIFMKRSMPYVNPLTLLTLTQICDRGRAKLPEVTVPFLVLWGKLDEFIPDRCINEIMEKTKSRHKNRIDYDNYGHAMMFLTYWQEIAEDIRAFLDGHTLFQRHSTKYPMKTITEIIETRTSTTVTKKTYNPFKDADK